jgi:hypothetical protein
MMAARSSAASARAVEFGSSVALSANSTTALVGACWFGKQGAAHVFNRFGSTWAHQNELALGYVAASTTWLDWTDFCIGCVTAPLSQENPRALPRPRPTSAPPCPCNEHSLGDGSRSSGKGTVMRYRFTVPLRATSRK